MNYFKYVTPAIFFLSISLSSDALALDIYVDTKTKQLFSEPGIGREFVGTVKGIELPATDNAQDVNADDNQETRITEIKTSNEASSTDNNIQIRQGKDGAFSIETADGDFNFKLGGRINVDTSFSNHDHFTDAAGNNIEANDGTEIRRGRLKFEGTFYKDWFFKSEVDFAENNVAITDMFIQYHGLEFARIRAGQQKQAFSRELQESANDLLFMERSAMNVLNGRTVNRAVGINVFSHGKSIFGLGQNWTGQIGIYGDTVNANNRNIFADEGWGVSSRVTFAPIAAQDKAIHIGVAGNYREPNDAGEVIDKPLTLAYETTNMSNLDLISTLITDINNIKMLGIEGHGLKGPFSIGGEFANSWIDLKGGAGSRLNFNGWYAEAAWTLTGESRVYNNGLFYRVIPENTFSFAKGGLGAWELAMRYAEVDLNDGAFKGGELGNLTVGLNWYPNQIVRLMANYDKVLRINDSPLIPKDGGKIDDLNTFMFRTQLAF